MHTSLTTRANLILILIWAGILIGMLAMNWPQPHTPITLAFALGVAAGFLQILAMKGNEHQFLEAKSAKEVRQALTSTRSGKFAIALLWVTALGMFVWAFLLAPQNPLVLWIPAYASFALARELVALPAVIRLGAST